MATKNKVFKYFIFGLIISLLSDIPDTNYILYNVSRLVVITLTLAAIICSEKKSVKLLIYLLICCNDLQINNEFPDLIIKTSSIWNFNFFFMKASWLISLILITQLIKINKVLIPNNLKFSAIYIVLFSVLISFINGNYKNAMFIPSAIQDFKFSFFLITSILIFYTYFMTQNNKTDSIICLFICANVARHFINFLYVLLNVGPEMVSGVSRGSVDSAKGTVILLIFLGINLVIIKRKYVLGTCLTFVSAVLLMVYTTRNLWLTFIVGSLFFLYMIESKKRILFLLYTFAIIAVCSFYLYALEGNKLFIVKARVNTFFEKRDFNSLEVNVGENFLSNIDPIRYTQILNINKRLQLNKTYFFGEGFGGVYEDTAIQYPENMYDAYDAISLNNHQYYRAHDFALQIILKYGLFGLIIIPMIWIYPSLVLVFKLKTNSRFNKYVTERLSLISFLAFMPTCMLQTYWSSKGLFINGIVIGYINFCISKKFYK